MDPMDVSLEVGVEARGKHSSTEVTTVRVGAQHRPNGPREGTWRRHTPKQFCGHPPIYSFLFAVKLERTGGKGAVATLAILIVGIGSGR